ncbi:MAG TPA: ATP-binding protein [Thermoanaerobaculia bacterium]|nr:ATP-binding protein [Thermoanaerobaculia bacterium]
MGERHSLLARQIRRFFGTEEGMSEHCVAFLDAVDAAYRQFDDDRAMLERSMDLSSQELMEANAALRRSLEEKARLQTLGALGHLVGGLAHEVRNPLFAITATLDALLDTLDDSPANQTVRRALEGLQEPTSRLSELMSELLEYGKPLARNLAPGALGAVVEEALEDCRALAQAKGVRLRAELGGRHLCVGMVRRRLLMALSNLIQNAVQHTPSGGEVVVETTRFEEGGRAWARCAIQDSGCGFHDEDLPHVFEPFFTRRRGGTGLGLSIVQRVVDEQQGSIQAANRPGGGAAVVLDFPIWDGPAQGRRQAEASPFRISAGPQSTL